MSHKLRLLANAESGRDLHHLIWQCDAGVRESFRRPGQFLTLTVSSAGEERQGYFAIASRPGAEHLELLVKRSGEPAGTLCDLPPDSIVTCGEAQGAGFADPEPDVECIHLFAMGSGLAPIRSYIQAHLYGTQRPKPMALTLWQSAFATDRLPFREEYAQWREAGIEVIVCLDEAGTESTGSVVDRLKELAPDLSRCAAYWIGSPEFGLATQAATADLGLPSRAFLTNH
jgi:ferredoxin-NADP reductase